MVDTSGSVKKTRLEINFHQPNKSVNALIQSDRYLQMAANGGIRENYHQERHGIIDPEAFFPVAKNPPNSPRSTARHLRTNPNYLNSQMEVMCLGLSKCSAEFNIFSSNL